MVGMILAYVYTMKTINTLRAEVKEAMKYYSRGWAMLHADEVKAEINEMITRSAPAYKNHIYEK